VSKQHLTRRSRQSGAVLIVSLLLLLVMTILGIVMMQTTRMQERMAGANRDLNMALQGAEAGLRYGESIIDGYVTQPVTVGSLPCTVCQPGTLPVAIYDDTQFNWAANAQTYGNSGLTGNDKLKANPQYTIEDIATVQRNGLELGQDVKVTREFYQVTARSTGATGNAVTVLQSTYTRVF